MTFYDKIYENVKRIPKGKVATYGQIAMLSGNPRASRVVGRALHINPCPGAIPCHRVVNRYGKLAPCFAFGGTAVQKTLLESEGIIVNDDNTVDINDYIWHINEL